MFLSVRCKGHDDAAHKLARTVCPMAAGVFFMFYERVGQAGAIIARKNVPPSGRGSPSGCGITRRGAEDFGETLEGGSGR